METEGPIKHQNLFMVLTKRSCNVVLTLAKRNWHGSKICTFLSMRQLCTCFFNATSLVLFGRLFRWLLDEPCSVSHLFCGWLGGFSKELKPLLQLGATATYRSLWLCINDISFEKKKHILFVHVIHSVVHWLCT